MSPRGGRTKKLIVAFHFYRSNQTGWKCDACRKSGLDRKRRCGFLPAVQKGPVATIWTGGGVGVTECPKTVVTAFSIACLEEYFALRAVGRGAPWRQIWAKLIDAWQVLDEEMRKEGSSE